MVDTQVGRIGRKSPVVCYYYRCPKCGMAWYDPQGVGETARGFSVPPPMPLLINYCCAGFALAMVTNRVYVTW